MGKKKNTKLFSEVGLAGRYLAFQALCDESIRALPTDRVGILAQRHGVPARERGLALDLTAGCIKRQLSLDLLIETFSSRKLIQIPPTVLTLLRLGAYQLIFEDKVPDFAAVDTTVTLAGSLAGRQAVGFVNAILRNLQRGITERDIVIDQDNAKFVLPVLADRGVKFNREILPVAKDTQEYLSLAYSYPRWLVELWLAVWPAEQLRNILAAGNARPALVCRPNPVKLTDPPAEQLAEILTTQGCRVKTLPEVGMVELIEGPLITDLPAFRDGLFQIQDPTAAEAVRQLMLEPGAKVLDLCAGLGTKTTQLAERTHDRAQIIASDLSDTKLEKLRRNADRLGLKFIQTFTLKELEAESFSGYFDAILLDVPCSNSGVFDRRPEARWRICEKDISNLAGQSLTLLHRAEKMIQPAGRIVFSTCSIDHEENGDVIRKFTGQSDWTVVDERVYLPPIDPETGKTVRTGGYWAVLRKKGE